MSDENGRPVGVRGGLALAALGVAAGLICYWFTLSYGFDYDDYHLLRPYTRHEVAQAFLGSWDPSGIEAKFYRPLTTAFYAARFWILGVDARAYHALSLVLFGVAAGLFGWFAAVIGGGRRVGVLATLVYVVHPAMVRSQVVWATNQMHLLMSLIVGGAFVWWAVHARTGKRWGTLVLASALAILVKEDGVMLWPSLVAVQVAYRLLVDRTAPWPPWKPVLAGVAVVGVLLVVRAFALDGLGGYGGTLRAARLWSNYLSGMRLGFLVHRPDGSSLGVWTQYLVFVTLIAGGAAALWRRQARSGFVLLTGCMAAMLFNAPFVLVSKAEQLHLVASFSAIALTAAVTAVWNAGVSRWGRTGLLALSLAGLTLLGLTARQRAELYRPLGPWVLRHDDLAQGWPGLPAEVWDWLDEKQRTKRMPAAGPLSNLPVIAFGAYGWEPGEGVARMRWAGERFVLLPRPDVGELQVPMAPLTPLRDARFRVLITTAQGGRSELMLDGDRWTTLTIPLDVRRAWFPFQRAVTIHVSPTWRPAGFYPGNQDQRGLSVRLGEVRGITRAP